MSIRQASGAISLLALKVRKAPPPTDLRIFVEGLVDVDGMKIMEWWSPSEHGL